MKYCEKDGARLRCIDSRSSGLVTHRRYTCPKCSSSYKTTEAKECMPSLEVEKNCSHAKTCRYRMAMGNRGSCDAVDEQVCEFSGYLEARYDETYIARELPRRIVIEL